MKKPNLNKPVFRIFEDAATEISLGRCPFCGKEILESDFRDELSRREYSISGICQRCQDNVFGA